MPFCDDLKVLFPKYSMEYCKRTVSITEDSSSAKVKELIWSNSDFHKIDATIVKDMTSFFQKANSSDIFHLDCDGIVIFEKNGKKYMFFSELKSTFSKSELFSAKDQIISSYLKINMLMHLLRCYNYDDFVIKGFIACLPPKKGYLRDLNKQQLSKPGSKYKTDADFVIDLCYYKEKKTKLVPTDCFKLKGLPLGNTGIFKEIEFNYVEVPEGTSSITLDVDNYI
ncbi:hypothetical protein Q3C19_13985 [Bacteroides sp. ET489]|nr:hypothetical protein [Bacteroides sp. ET489]